MMECDNLKKSMRKYTAVYNCLKWYGILPSMPGVFPSTQTFCIRPREYPLKYSPYGVHGAILPSQEDEY